MGVVGHGSRGSLDSKGEPPPFLFQRKERQGEEVASEGMKKNAIVSDRTIREVDREANNCLRGKG